MTVEGKCKKAGGRMSSISLTTHVLARRRMVQEEDQRSPQGSFCKKAGGRMSSIAPLCKKAPNTCIVTNARRRTVLTAGQFVQEGWGQDVIDHPSSQEERQVILCAGHIQLEIIHTVQQALEALLHLISLNDLVVQAGQQVCCHLVLPEEEEEEDKEEEEALAGS